VIDGTETGLTAGVALIRRRLESHDCGAPAAAGLVAEAERFHERRTPQQRMDGGPQGAGAFPMNDPRGGQTAPAACDEVFLHHAGRVGGTERVKIEFAGDRNAHGSGILVHGRNCGVPARSAPPVTNTDTEDSPAAKGEWPAAAAGGPPAPGVWISAGRAKGYFHRWAAWRWRSVEGAPQFLLKAAGRLLEFTDRFAHAAGQTGQSLAAEEQQRDHHDDQDLCATDVEDGELWRQHQHDD